MRNKNTRRGNTQESSYVGRGFPAERAVWPLTNQRSTTAANCWAKPNLHKRHAGFTLIELLVVVLIIGILAAVAVPQYQVAVEKSRAAEALTIISSLQKAIDLYVLEHGYPPEEDMVWFVGSYPGDGHYDLDIDIESMLDCTQDEGKSCASKHFWYQAYCEGEESLCEIYAKRFSKGQSDPNDQYYFLAQKFASHNGAWKKQCTPSGNYPYSDKLCKSLEAQGWGYNELK